MVGHGAKFSHKMAQAVAALLTSRTAEEAARAAGVGTTTLRRWARNPEFQAAYREARSALLSQAIARLQGAAGAAATTVLKIMLSPKEPAGARLRAAEIVLEQASRASSLEDLARFADLERNTTSKKRPFRSSAAITLLKSPPQVEAAGQQDGSNSEGGGQGVKL